MKIIDMSKWERAEHYRFFKRMDYPQYNICMNIDITHFLEVIKQRELPFYYSMVYATTYILNEIEEFRYRIQEDQVVLYDKIHPSFTDLSKGSDLFKVVTVDLMEDIKTFVDKAKEKSENQTDYFVLEGRDDLVYITCIPWISFTHLSHTISLNNNDSVPRISWGKYFQDRNKVLLPFSVQVHHSFVDGIKVGRYIECLQEYLNQEPIIQR